MRAQALLAHAHRPHLLRTRHLILALNVEILGILVALARPVRQLAQQGHITNPPVRAAVAAARLAVPVREADSEAVEAVQEGLAQEAVAREVVSEDADSNIFRGNNN